MITLGNRKVAAGSKGVLMINNLLPKSFLFVSVLFSFFAGHAQYIDRIENSPYPGSRKADTLFVIDDTKLTPQQQFVVQSLQGLLAIYKPKIYRVSDEGSLMWISELTGRYGVRSDYTYLDDYLGLIKHFQDSINGYILCSMSGGSANAAISLSSIYNAITYPTRWKTIFHFCQKVLDTRNMNEEDVYAKYHDSLSKHILTYQKEGTPIFLGDYSIFAMPFSFMNPSAPFLPRPFLRI